MTTQLLLTEHEAAGRLRISARTLRRARQEGQLHYVLIGRAVRYTLTDLESFVDRLRKVEPKCPAQGHSRPPLPKPKRSSQGAEIVPFSRRNTAG